MTRTHEELERRREQINKHLDGHPNWNFNHRLADRAGTTGIWEREAHDTEKPPAVKVIMTEVQNGVRRYSVVLYPDGKTSDFDVEGLATGRAVASAVEHFMALVDDGHVEP
jgi:hypothetical protein